MRKYLSLVALCFLFACSEQHSENTTATSTDTIVNIQPQIETVVIDSMCFVRTEGKNNKDTFALKVITTNNEVSGKLMYLYFEKDWRIGKITGTKNGDIINAKWVFMQEGMIDSTDISFQIQGNGILQKMPSFDKNSGKEVLNDTAAYNREFIKVDCASFPKYDFDFGI